MAFSGTTEKCRACDKTVHFVEMVSADGVPYHKTCFKCSHCNGLLVMGNFSSLDGALYCKPHFEQLYKECGSFQKNSSGKFEKPNGLSRAPSKLSTMFSGTQDKCAFCKKTAYPLEKVTVEGESYHKSCFRCSHGGCFITPSSYAALDGVLYCKPHFTQLFRERGSYNQLNKTASLKKTPSALSDPNIEEAKPEEAEEPKEDAEAEAESSDANPQDQR